MLTVRRGVFLGPDVRSRALHTTLAFYTCFCAIFSFSLIQATRMLLACSCLVSFETSSVCIELVVVRHGQG